MNEIEIRDALAGFAADAGPKAWVDACINPNRSGNGFVHATLYPNGLTGSGSDARISVEAATFAEAVDKLGCAWEARRSLADKATIRKMALAIIEITTDQGECSDAALRGAGFSQHQVAAMGALACSEATRLAAGGPFSIVKTAGRNAPSDLEAA